MTWLGVFGSVFGWLFIGALIGVLGFDLNADDPVSMIIFMAFWPLVAALLVPLKLAKLMVNTIRNLVKAISKIKWIGRDKED